MELALRLYLGMNLSLVLSYLAFRLGERALQKGFTSADLPSLLRWAQGILMASLVSPLFVIYLPQGPSSEFLENIQAPLAEMSGSFRPRQARPFGKKQPATKEDVAKNSPNFWMVWISEEGRGKRLAIGFVLVIFLLQSLRLLALSRRLLVNLRRSTPLRSVGMVRVVVSPDIIVPFSTVVGRIAWVALPESMLGNWTDFKIALKHELQHHRQKDTQWAMALEFFVSYFYLNPAAHSWKRRIHEMQELSCDRALIGRKVSSHEYASCLVRVAEAALGNRQRLVGTASMAAGSENPTYFKSFLRRRIEMLLQPQKIRPNRLRVFTLGTLVIGLVVATSYGAQQLAGKPELAKPAPGVVVTDPAIQQIAETALTAALKRHKASLGFVVVADPMTGRVLAVANEDRVEKQSERTPHWALSLQFGPASIIKAIVAASAVENKKTTFASVHDCEKSRYEWNGQVYQDWKAFDKLSTADTVVHSSNICGIKVGQTLGARGLAETLKTFGFGVGGTADGFPEARPGEIRQPKEGEDSAYVATVSTGYDGGSYVSPLELVQAFGAIANGGNLLKPQSNASATPQVLRRVLSEETANEMKEVLADVMVHGTAQKSASKIYRLAGKTATGYSRTHVGHDTLGGDSNMAGFIGFGPVNKPRLVILVIVENPTDRKGVHGAVHAAPVFREVAERTLRYLKVAQQ